MSEKRFTINPSTIVDDCFVIIDNENKYAFPTLESTLNYMFCKALNELYEENEQLKSACTKYNINPKNLERVLDDFDSMLDWEYSGNLNDDGEYK